MIKKITFQSLPMVISYTTKGVDEAIKKKSLHLQMIGSTLISLPYTFLAASKTIKTPAFPHWGSCK
ncbi:MAG: hypothetical protein RL329_2654 [Bacteroidota bacterium]|jgi:hypothetical protein